MAGGLMKKPSLSLDANLVKDDLPLEVVAGIFLGSIYSAFNLEALISHNITHILNASRMAISFPKEFTYLSVEIRDKDDANILACIPTTNIFIEGCLDSGGGILVHCFGGKSRSPAFIAAYMMSSYRWSFDSALALIKTVRPAADINRGFEAQLRAYAAANYDVYIAQQLLLRTRIRELYLLRETGARDAQDGAPPSSSAALALPTRSAKPRLKSFRELDLLEKENTPAESAFVCSEHAISRSNSRQKRSLSDAPSDLDFEAIQSGHCDNNGPIRDGTACLGELDTDLPYAHSPLDKTDSSQSQYSPAPAAAPPLQSSFHSRSTARTENSAFSLLSGLQSVKERESGDSALDESVDSLGSDSSLSVAPFDPARPSTREKEKEKESVTRNDSNKSLRTAGALSASESHAERHCSFAADVERASLESHPAAHELSQRATSSAFSVAAAAAEYPACKLSRPGSHWIRIIPPLLGLERAFHCAWCDAKLFALRNVLRVDIENISRMLDDFQQSMQRCGAAQHSRLKRDFDDVPPDAAEDAFPPTHCAVNLNTARAAAPLDDALASPAGSASSFLPPITKRNAHKPAGFSFFAASPVHVEEEREIQTERETDRERDTAEAARPGRHSGRSFRGFSIETSADDSAVAPPRKSSLRVTPTAASAEEAAERDKERERERLLPALPSSASSPQLSHPAIERAIERRGSAHKAMHIATTTAMTTAVVHDESPRVSIPPHRLLAENNFVFAHPPTPTLSRPHSSSNSSAAAVNRPQSAEKRRWLARLSLLRNGESAASSSATSAAPEPPAPMLSAEQKNAKNRLSNLAEADDLATHHFADPSDKYFCVEYLDWMGPEVLQYPNDHGELACPGCKHVVGAWSWNPSMRLLKDGRLEAPLFRIHKSVVQHTELDFDPTPNATPRPSEDFGSFMNVM